MTQKLTSVDAAFFQLESHETPMHVAGLQVFSIPEGAGADYTRKLVAHLRSPRALAAPWNLRLKRSALAALRPEWVVDHDVDLDYHVRHLALPQPGGERELGVLVSRLHSHRLNRRQPLWECHVIEGLGPVVDPESGKPLSGNRFALFTKIHHALVDGVTAMRLLTDSLSLDADTFAPPPWAVGRPKPRHRATPRSPVETVRDKLSVGREAGRGFARLANSARRDEEPLLPPFAAPHSILNARVTGQRRLATQQFELSRLKAVTRAAGVSVNDLVLMLSGTALRRFLKDANALPDRPLVAAVPVSRRGNGESDAGNAVSMMFTRIGTDIADPATRLAAIHRGTQAAKAHLQQMSAQAQALYTNLLFAPLVVQTATALAGRTRPCFNVTVSNVPGPAEPRYFNGARLVAMYPVSIATHGQALNITCTSYAGTLNFGFVGCPDALPSVQRVAVYVADALAEIEEALGITAAPDKKGLGRAA